MRKRRVALIAFLAMVMSVCCIALVACSGNKGEKFNITWNLDQAQHVTVAAEGYKKLPEKVAKDTEIIFTATPEAGYSATVSGATKQSNGSYKVTVKKDVTIKVTESKVVSKVEVTSKPEKLIYEGGEELDKTGMKVTVSYGVGGSEEITNYTVNYQNGDTFLAGDTAFTVSYGGKSAEVALDETVKATITLNLSGASVTDNDLLASWQDAYSEISIDNATGKVTLIIDKPLEEALILPTDAQMQYGSVAGDYAFVSWNGDDVQFIENNTLPAGTGINISLTARFTKELVVINDVHITMYNIAAEGEPEELAPCLIINGKFQAATEAYLYLYEGNNDVELKGMDIKGARGEDFTLVFDARDLVDADAANIEQGKKGYKGAWMDIKFRAMNGDKVETQEIDLKRYSSDFVNLAEEVVTEYNGNWYRFFFQTYDPSGKGEFQHLKFVFTDTTKPTYMMQKIELVEEDGVAYIVLTAKYMASTNVEEAKSFFESLYLDVTEYNGSWSSPSEESYNRVVTTVSEGELVYSIRLSLAGVVAKENFMHIGSGSNNNLSGAGMVAGSVTADGKTYTLSLSPNSDWTSGLLWITVTDAETEAE